ncbi:unnamed protein product [Miscanthus lutarioriparius]|uniref:DUF659 domain-containing protein n=1 Tax=Miscanthus lutarioriparius TaxID=422564 RepID=A0A811QKS5_9POAL|nr:unnamed protein product [Miscanthus lutarioriparius]
MGLWIQRSQQSNWLPRLEQRQQEDWRRKVMLRRISGSSAQDLTGMAAAAAGARGSGSSAEDSVEDASFTFSFEPALYREASNKMASPNMSSASASASGTVGSAATNTTDIKSSLWDHVQESGGKIQVKNCFFAYCSFLKQTSLTTTRGTRGVYFALEKAWALEDRKHLDALISRSIYSDGYLSIFREIHIFEKPFTFACVLRNMQGYVIPGYNKVREGLLKQERRHIETLLESTKNTWAKKGVTICSMVGRSSRRPISNFVCCFDKAPMFLRADNCEGWYKSKEYIAEKLRGIIEEVGRHNVVQIITDNAANCKGAGLIIESEYDNIFWTPCVLHTLNLAMKNICEPKIGNNPSDEEIFAWRELEFDVKTEATMIKNFIMNHGMRLSMFNEFSRLKLLSIGETRFAYVVCMLKWFVEIFPFTKIIMPNCRYYSKKWLDEEELMHTKTGETRMWDVGGDSFDSLGDIGILEVVDLSLDEPELQAVSFGLDDPHVHVVDDNETNEE